jgi:hypothetical protein
MSNQSRLEMLKDGFRLHSLLEIPARELFTPNPSLLVNITHQTHLHLLSLLLGCPCSLMNLLVVYASEPRKVTQVKTRLCS